MTASIEAQSKSQTNSADNVADSVKLLELGSRATQHGSTRRSRATSALTSKRADVVGEKGERSDKGSKAGCAVSAQRTIRPSDSLSNRPSRAGSVTPSMKSNHPRLDSEESVRTRESERRRAGGSERGRAKESIDGHAKESSHRPTKEKSRATSLASDWSMPVSTREGTKVLKGSRPVEMPIRISPAEGNGKGV